MDNVNQNRAKGFLNSKYYSEIRDDSVKVGDKFTTIWESIGQSRYKVRFENGSEHIVPTYCLTFVK